MIKAFFKEMRQQAAAASSSTFGGTVPFTPTSGGEGEEGEEGVDMSTAQLALLSQASPCTSSVRSFVAVSRNDEQYETVTALYDTCLQHTNYRLPISRKRRVNPQEKLEIMDRVKTDWHSNERAWRQAQLEQEEFTQVRSVRTKCGGYEYYCKTTDVPVAPEDYQTRYEQYIIQQRVQAAPSSSAVASRTNSLNNGDIGITGGPMSVKIYCEEGGNGNVLSNSVSDEVNGKENGGEATTFSPTKATSETFCVGGGTPIKSRGLSPAHLNRGVESSSAMEEGT